MAISLLWVQQEYSQRSSHTNDVIMPVPGNPGSGRLACRNESVSQRDGTHAGLRIEFRPIETSESASLTRYDHAALSHAVPGHWICRTNPTLLKLEQPRSPRSWIPNKLLDAIRLYLYVRAFRRPKILVS